MTITYTYTVYNMPKRRLRTNLTFTRIGFWALCSLLSSSLHKSLSWRRSGGFAGSAMKEQGSDAQAPQGNLKQSETQQSHFNLMTTEIFANNNMFACPMMWKFQRSCLILKVIWMIYRLPTQWRFSSAHQNIPKFKVCLI